MDQLGGKVMKNRLLCMVLAALLVAGLVVSVYAQEEKGPIVIVGGSFAYVRDKQGVIHVWGDNQFGQLGKGNAAQSMKPAIFKTKADFDPADVKDIITGCDYSYFLMDDGSIWGAGNSTNASLTKEGIFRTHYRLNFSDPTVKMMASGFGHTLAVNEAGEVYGWGRNSNGQVGIGSPNNNNVGQPTKIEGLPKIVQVACGGKFSLALDAEGGLWGWGDNQHHQISPTDTKRFNEPVKIDTGDIQIRDIDAGGSFSAVVDQEGKMYMWGINQECQLGIEASGDVLSPMLVDLPLPVKTMEIYSSMTYVILEDGSLWGWGNNTYGQLGLGFRTASGLGVTLSKIDDGPYTMMSGGSLFLLAVKEDGTMMAAGINKFGQLGLSTGKYAEDTLFENGFNINSGWPN
jgi:alpha-tubulin suppressor-like RCC1 family protein